MYIIDFLITLILVERLRIVPHSWCLFLGSDMDWLDVALVFDAGRSGRREGRLETNILTKTRLNQHLLGGGDESY